MKFRFVRQQVTGEQGPRFYTEYLPDGSTTWGYVSGSVWYDETAARLQFESICRNGLPEAGKMILEEREA